MIKNLGPVRVITNDDPGNKVGDYALIRVDLAQGANFLPVGGWRLVGCFVGRYGKGGAYVDRTYVFEGTP